MRGLASVLALALLLGSAAPARALSEADRKTVERGLDALYRGDREGAEKIFTRALGERPGSPPLSLGRAIVAWWVVEDDFLPADAPEQTLFENAVDRAISDAERALARNPKDAEALVCRGAALGLRGRREAALKRWFKAYRDGRRTYKDEQDAVKLDPKLYDAYLGIGAFDYYLARLSRFVRLFAFSSGDKDRGLAELQLAQQGQFSAVAAKLLLVSIDWSFEKRPDQAWARLEELTALYPGSPTIGFMRLIGLFQLRDAAGLEKEARAYLSKAENGAPFFRPIDRAAGHYFLGLSYQLSGRVEAALEEHRAALTMIPAGHATRGVPLLFIGECLDLIGRRDEAVGYYKQALAERPFWGVPRYAKFLVKHPFRRDSNPLPARGDRLGE